MRTQATFRWTSEDPSPAHTLTGLIADGLTDAGFGCTQIEDLDFALAFRVGVGRRNFFLMIGEVDDGVRQWLVSTKSEFRRNFRFGFIPKYASHKSNGSGANKSSAG